MRDPSPRPASLAGHDLARGSGYVPASAWGPPVTLWDALRGTEVPDCERLIVDPAMRAPCECAEDPAEVHPAGRPGDEDTYVWRPAHDEEVPRD